MKLYCISRSDISTFKIYSLIIKLIHNWLEFSNWRVKFELLCYFPINGFSSNNFSNLLNLKISELKNLYKLFLNLKKFCYKSLIFLLFY